MKCFIPLINQLRAITDNLTTIYVARLPYLCKLL